MRTSRYFRISVTSRCNFGCPYCHREGLDDAGNHELSPDEIEFAVRAAKTFGYTKVKLTGGEPTLHKDILDIVSRLSHLGLKDLSIITNGSTLRRLAKPLWDAGLRRLNISLNTLDPDRFSLLTGCAAVSVNDVLSGMEAALNAGFRDTKLNFVYSSDRSEGDLKQLLQLSARLGLTLVVLPVIDSENLYTLDGLYEKLSAYGIQSEREITDAEGIRKRLLRLETGATVLLRRDELMNIRPFTFCDECPTRNMCREGIFPLRLSAAGELLPCMAENMHRLSIKTALTQRDEAAVNAAFMSVAGMYRS